MSLASKIRDRVKQIPEGRTFRYDDLRIARTEYTTAAKTLERLQKESLIKKVSKGVFYKPEQTVFGELEPDYSELLRPYLFENGKRVAYETGTALYNRLGLTTQMAFRTKIASRGKRIQVSRGPLQADSVKSYVEVTNSNADVLGLLDAFKDIKRIPDSSVGQSVRRLASILRDLDGKQIASLVRYAMAYPPRVKALVGAVLQYNGYQEKELEQLKDSLNPLTTIKLGLKETELPTKNNWYIE